MGFIKGRKEMLLTIVTDSVQEGEHVVLRLNNCFEKIWFFHSLTTEMLKREKYYPDK